MNPKKPLSACCEKPMKVNMASDDGRLFCTHCGNDCEVSSRREPFRGYSTISKVRKPSGEGEVFKEVWGRCKGKSEVSGKPLLTPEHPMWHWQFSHLLPKGTYTKRKLSAENIVACTVHEHTEEWPFVKEKSDEELVAMDMKHWIPTVTLFRAERLKANTT